MPLYVDRVNDVLRSRRDDLKQIDANTQVELDVLRQALAQFQDMSQAEVEQAIASKQRTGARPTAEQDDLPIIVPFTAKWDHHQEAREWAASQLTGVTTVAADGSQIAPVRDMSMQIGLVQVGWFANSHAADLPYEKDVYVELLTQLEFDAAVDNDIQREVDWRRFQGEVEALISFLEEYAGQAAVALFDGSFIVSFVGSMAPERQHQYTQAVQRLLTTSKQTEVPIVAYIDNSYSSDVVTLIQYAVGRSNVLRSSDASLFRESMAWGDRSRIYLCDRDDEVLGKQYYNDVCLGYLKTTSDNAPARVEFPKWVFDRGLHNWVFDVIRAECVVGLGYPYPLETADATAVLTMEDRERFHRIFQTFAETEDIPLRFSRKSTSKRGRR